MPEHPALPTAEQLREVAASIGFELAPWQVEAAQTLLRGGQVVFGRQNGRWPVARVVDEYVRSVAGGEELVVRHMQTQREVAVAFDVDPAVVGIAEPPAAGHKESDVLAAIDALERDDIDDLVDMQLRQTPSGYDFNINQPARCLHCPEESHSVPITKRMQEIRSLWRSTITYFEDGERVSDEAAAQLDAYRFNEDDSEIACPGSEFVGPPKPRTVSPAWAWPGLDPDGWLPSGRCDCAMCRVSRNEGSRGEGFREPSRSSASGWFTNLVRLSNQLGLHLFRGGSVVLLPDQQPVLEMVLGMQVRHVPGLRCGYVAYEYEATRAGLVSAMCDYLSLDRVGTSPVIVASPDVVQGALRMTDCFCEPVHLTWRPTYTVETHRFTELGNMRVDPLPVSAVYVGFRTDAPSAEDISRMLPPPEPSGIPWTVERLNQLRWPSLPEVLTSLGWSDSAEVAVAPAPTEPDPAAPEEPQERPSRRERRGRPRRPLPMWVPRVDGRNRRGRRS